MSAITKIRKCVNFLNVKVLDTSSNLSKGKKVLFSTSAIFPKLYSMEEGGSGNSNVTLFVGKYQAQDYAQFRPTYPETVYKTIFNFCKDKSSKHELAIDVGCGPGLSTQPLTKYFSKVIGVDVSQEQISNAPTGVSGLTFCTSTAEELSFVEDGSVDLVTVAQALHWFQMDRFYLELDRILKPGGSIVAYGYCTLSVDDKEVNDYLMHIHRVKLVNSWSSDRNHVESKYVNIPSPYGDWLRNDDFVLEKHFTIEQFLGYLNSWSSIQTYNKQNPGTDLLEEIHEKLLNICNQDDGAIFKVTWPVFMLMAKKPGK